MQVKVDEQERLIRELEGALQRSTVEIDRRMMSQQQEYEQKIQVLMHQLMECGNVSNGAAGGDAQPMMNGHDPVVEQKYVHSV